VVGFDDSRLAARVSPPLTTVRQPTIEMGRAAVEMLSSRVRTPSTEIVIEHRVLPGRIVRRKSVAPRPRVHIWKRNGSQRLIVKFIMLRGWGLLRLVCVACLSATNSLAASSVEFTYVPPYGSFNDLQGKVYGVNTASNRVAVFIYVTGAGWFTKPNCASPLTTIQPDGTWTAT